jgi:hypothetical protein
MDFTINDDNIRGGQLTVDADGDDMTKHHQEVIRIWKPKIVSAEAAVRYGTNWIVKMSTSRPGMDALHYVLAQSAKEAKKKALALADKGSKVIDVMKEEVELDEVKYPNYRGGSPYRAGKHDRFTGKEDRCQIRCGDAKTSEEVDSFLGYSQNRALDDIDTDAVHSAQGFIPGPIDVFGRDAGKVGQDVIKEFGKRVQVVFEETIAEGREKPARQLVNPNKEVLVVKKNKVVVIDKKDQTKYERQGWQLAEETTDTEIENEPEISENDEKDGYKSLERSIRSIVTKK